MIKTFWELEQAGFVDGKGHILRPLDMQKITGKESAVWQEWTVRCCSRWCEQNGEVFCRVENYNGVKLYDYLDSDELQELRVVAFRVVDNYAVDRLVGENELESIEGWGCATADLESLKNPSTVGTCWEIEIKESPVITRVISLYCPEEWN